MDIARPTSKLRLSSALAYLSGAVATVIIAMTVLTLWMSARITATVTKSAAADTAMLISALIAPEVQELAGSQSLSPAAMARLDRVSAPLLAGQFPSIKIWLRDGTIAYASNKSLIGQRFASNALKVAFSGQIVSNYDDLTHSENEDERRLSMSLLEVYAAIYRTGTSEIIAVGEFYTDARALAAEIREIRTTSAAIVATITAPMVLILLGLATRAGRLADRHRHSLEDNVAFANRLADQNDELRRAAEDARAETIKSNERLLQQIGQDLHDGPVQLVSLLALRLSSKSPDQNAASVSSSAQQTPYDLAARALKELRDVSSGLVLPEIEGLTLGEAIRHAVREHEFATQTHVSCHVTALPREISPSIKICLYRLVQEGLRNAFHHAGGRGQRVDVAAGDGSISVTVGDDGPSADSRISTDGLHVPLGLAGLRRRVELLHGVFEFARTAHGSKLQARLPT